MRESARLERLPIRAVYSSPLERALETAEPIASRHSLEPERVDDLGEVRFGAWEGATFDELDRRSRRLSRRPGDAKPIVS